MDTINISHDAFANDWLRLCPTFAHDSTVAASRSIFRTHVIDVCKQNIPVFAVVLINHSQLDLQE